MKVLRSDLITGFKNKLFESDVENANEQNLIIKNNRLASNFTSKIVKNGFKLSGYVIDNIVYDCDRCLEPFSKNDKINVRLFLSNDISGVEYNSFETIFFPDQDNSINLKEILIEILMTEKPLKNLCSNFCKGLCSSCGVNFNNRICSCGK